MGQTVKEEASPLGSGLTLGPFCTGVEVSDLAPHSRIPLGGISSLTPLHSGIALDVPPWPGEVM